MANQAEKRRLHEYALWSKVHGVATVLTLLIFIYFRIYNATEFGFWNWVKFGTMIACFYFGQTKVLFAIRNGLPRPDMFSDILTTSYIATLLWCISDYFFYIMLWLPPYYGYLAWNQMKGFWSMAQAAAQGGSGNGDANDVDESKQNGPTMSRQERRRAERIQQKQAKKARKRN